MCNRLMRVCAGEPALAPRRLRRRPLPRLHSGEAGQQMVLVSLMLPILLVFVGLVVDVGNVFVHRRMAQNAADAAAVAGSVQLSVSQASARATALAYAASNNYSNEAVTVTFPTGCIRVDVDEDVRPLLASLIWNGTVGISARATACMMVVEIGSSVIVLEPKDHDALEVSGNGRLTVTRGNIQVNSSSSEAVSLSGNGRIVTKTPVTIVGGYEKGKSTSFDPKPITGAPVIPDPLAGLPEPAKPKNCSSKEIKSSGTLEPGCYTGGIKLSSSEKLTLKPGEYWIDGGIKLSGKAEINGENVMIYIAGDDVDLSGGSKCKLTPPSSGVYAGVTFFGARAEDIEFDLTGGSSLSGLEGIIYSASGKLELGGNAVMRANFAVGKVDMTGNSDLTVEGFTSTNWATTEYRMTE